MNGTEGKFPQISRGPSGGIRPDLKALKPTGALVAVPPNITPPPPVGKLDNGQPLYGVNASLPLKLDSGALSLRWDQGNCTMGPGVDGYNAKSCDCVNSVGDWYHQYATGTVTTKQCQSTFDPGVASAEQSIGCSMVTVTKLSQDYVAPSDCCNKCEVNAESVQLVYWPEDHLDANNTNLGNSTTRISGKAKKRADGEVYGKVSDGFTFTYPSVYVLYKNVAATASCVANVGSYRPIGSVIPAVTRAYAPEALSTAKCMINREGAGLGYCISPVGEPIEAQDCFQGQDEGWQRINYKDLYAPPPTSVMLSVKQKCFTGNTIASDFAAMLYAKPQLSMPPDVTDIDPVFHSWGGGTCTVGNLGVSDPPRALGEATALGPAVQQQPVTPAAEFGPTPTPPSPAAPIDPQPTATSEPGGFAMAPLAKASASAMVAPAPVTNDPAQSDPNTDPDTPAPVPSSQNAAAAPVAVSPGPATKGNANSEDPQQGNQPHQAVPATPQTQNDQQVAQQQTNSGNGGSGSSTSNGATTSEDNESSNPDPQSVPIILTPQQSDSGNSVSQPQNQQASQGQAKGQSSGNPGTPMDTFQTSQGSGQNGNQQAPDVISSGGTGQSAQQQAQPNSNVPFVNAPPQVGDQTVQKHANGDVVAGGTTIPEGQSANVDGHNVANLPNNVIVDGTSHAVVSQQAAPAQAQEVPTANVPFVNAPPQIGDQTVQKQANGNVVVGGTTIAEGQSASVDGHTVVNSPDNVIVDGASHAVVSQQAAQAQAQEVPTANVPYVNAPPQIGDQTVQKQANGNVVVGGTTIAEGQSASVDGHTVVNSPNNVIVDGASYALAPSPAPARAPSPAPFLQNQVVQVSSGGLQVAGQTLVPGTELSLQGHQVNYVGPGKVIVDGTTNSLAPISTSNPLVIGSQTLNRASNGGLVLAGQTLAPGAQATVSGAVYSLAGDSSVIANGQTYALPPTENAYLVQAVPTAKPVTPPTPVTLSNGLVITPQAQPSSCDKCAAVYNLPNGASISAGGTVAVVSGTTYSLLPTGGLLVNGKSTLAVPSPIPTAINYNTVFSIGGSTFTAAPTGFVLPNGATLTPGAHAAIISGTLVSLGAAGTLLLGSSTITLPPQSIFVVGGKTFTAQPTGFVLAPGTTITPGGKAVTVAGTPISLATNSELDIGSQTVQLGPAMVTAGGVAGAGGAGARNASATSAATPIGPAIIGGLNGGAAPTATGGSQPFQGGASRIGIWKTTLLGLTGLGIGLLAVCN